MSTAFVLPDELVEDEPPTVTAEGDTSPLRCQEPGCTNAVTKPARGVTPKFCDEHKRTRATGGGRSGRSSWANATVVEEALSKYAAFAGTGLQLVNRFDGQVIATGGPLVVHELVELARTDKKLRGYLEKIALPGKYAPLTLAVAVIVLPIAANHGLIPMISIFLPQETKPEGV